MVKTMNVKIKNRHQLDISIEVLEHKVSHIVAFVAHGLAGSRKQDHIKAMVNALHKKGLTVVSFDFTHSFGQSGGELEFATATSFLNDLEDVISWASTKTWYREPFVLAGHSLGGLIALIYASKFPSRVKSVIPIAALVPGKMWEAIVDPRFLTRWREDGFYNKRSHTLKGKTGRVGWALAEDVINNYDILKIAPKVKAPVLLIAGSEDKSAPLEQQQFLLEKLNRLTELHVIEGMRHNPRSKEELSSVEEIISTWHGV